MWAAAKTIRGFTEMQIAAFAPLYSNTGNGNLVNSVTATVAVAGTAVTAQLPSTSPGQNQIRIANTTAVWCQINFGNNSSVTAATVANSIQIAPGSVEVFTLDPTVTHASVLAGAGGTGAVVFTRGEGV